MHELSYFPVPHGYFNSVTYPSLGVRVNEQSALRHMHFIRPSRINHLELKREMQIGSSLTSGEKMDKCRNNF